MAVFDRCESNIIKLDDTHQLTCEIEAAENQQGHTVYVLKVQRGPLFDSSWHLSRRYSDFDALNSILSCSGIELPLPPKKVFGKLEREFVAERQQGLQNYINFLLSHPILSTTLYVKRFFDPERYSFNFAESSLQHVSMVFRSEADWEIIEPLHEFGWRIRKQYFLVKSKRDAKCLSLLSWTSFGPDKSFVEKDLTAVTKLLSSIKHPYIYPTSFMCLSEKGGLVIYDFVENGTLRDMLCKVKPKARFLKKYGKPKSYAAVQCGKIQTYGQQILLALKFLHDRELYHGHLHTGNIVLVDGVCKLMEVGNSIMGIPSMLRSYFLQLRKVQTVESIDVYSFGHVIYEMAFGMPLHQCCCDTFCLNSSPELRSVLEATLTTEACKRGLPSVSDLLMHPFFVSAHSTTSEEKVHLKISSQLKEGFKKAREQVEHRLKEEQKVIRRSQRLTKVQISSEEEKKKRLTERRKQQKSQNAPNSTENGLANSLTPSVGCIDTPICDTSPTPGSAPPLLSPPPPPPPLPPLIPASPPQVSNSLSSGTNRTALLSSIQTFSKSNLKKCETKDCSVPKI